ncbi:hypothetical protein Tco_0642346 [Tanacetum coccineum]
MAEMFGLLKELTASSFGKNTTKPIEVIDRKEETEGGADDETIRNVTKESEEELVEMPRLYLMGRSLGVLRSFMQTTPSSLR